MAFWGIQRLWYVSTPELNLYCNSDCCEGGRVFYNNSGSVALRDGEWQEFFITYTCRNCQKGMKYFAVIACRGEEDKGEAIKIGEWPPFGARIQTHLKTLIGEGREVFLKGRRAESQGMGIGAFSYYRRVVEENINIFLEVCRTFPIKI